MAKDLTNSPVDRQNILNNPYAIKEISGGYPHCSNQV